MQDNRKVDRSLRVLRRVLARRHEGATSLDRMVSRAAVRYAVQKARAARAEVSA